MPSLCPVSWSRGEPCSQGIHSLGLRCLTWESGAWEASGSAHSSCPGCGGTGAVHAQRAQAAVGTWSLLARAGLAKGWESQPENGRLLLPLQSARDVSHQELPSIHKETNKKHWNSPFLLFLFCLFLISVWAECSFLKKKINKIHTKKTSSNQS